MTSLHSFQGTELELANGKPFDPANPNPASIDLQSIAHSLGMQCRYGGHCRQFASIAEHSVLVASKLRRIGASPQLQIAGLHHDSHEALDGIGDVQRPAKSLLDATYRERVALIDEAVWRALACQGGGVLWTLDMLHHPLVKRIDVWALGFEARLLMRSCGEGWQLLDDGAAVPIPEHVEDQVYGWFPDQARAMFVGLHERLAKEILQG